jgi:septum formation protein
MTKIILASQSPRRAELLATIGVRFKTQPGYIDESVLPGESPADYIMRISRAKALAVVSQHQSGLVIAADTIVVVDDQILGKPTDEEDARRMLKELSWRWHQVMTCVTLIDAATGREAADYAITRVRFAEMRDHEIDWYISTGEPMDKAGAYGIQGKGGLFVEEVVGNYHNVVGLPLTLVYKLAAEMGHSLI